MSDFSLSSTTHADTASSMYPSKPTRGSSLRSESVGCASQKSMMLVWNLWGFILCWWGEWTSDGSHYSHPMRPSPNSKVISNPRKNFGGYWVDTTGLHNFSITVLVPLLLSRGCTLFVMLLSHEIYLKRLILLVYYFVGSGLRGGKYGLIIHTVRVQACPGHNVDL